MIFQVTIRNQAGDIISKRLKLIADILVRRLQATTPGKPAGRWVSFVEKNSARVSNPAGYLRYLDAGTGIYGPRGGYIVPRIAKALHWTENGHDVFVKRVKGIRPQRFISAAIDEVQE